MENSGKRSKNFSQQEVDLLLDLVNAKRNILENKRTDHVSLKDKENSWKELAESFNELNGSVVRDWKVLKGKYENLKKTCKKNFAKDKKYTSGTGGGPHQPNLISTTDVKVKDIIGTIPLEGLPSVCDSDFIGQSLLQGTSYEGETAIPSPDICDAVQVIEEIPVIQDLERGETIEVPVQPCSSNFTVQDLRKPTSTPLRIKRKRSLDSTVAGKKLEVLADEKQEVLQLQKQVLEDQIQFQKEEHKIKLEHFKEEHTSKMKLLELEIKNREFDLEMKRQILELDLKIKSKQLN